MLTRDRAQVGLIIALLFVAILSVVLAVVISDGYWLLIPAALCLLGVSLLARATTRDPARGHPVATDAVDDPDPVIVLIVVLALLALAVVIVVATLIVVTGSHRTTQTQTHSAQPSTSAIAPRLSTTPSPPPAGSLAQAQYETAGSDVRLRVAPNTQAAIVLTMPSLGTSVVLSCYETGEPIYGLAYWYRATVDEVTGYISGMWVDTGTDPGRTGLPSCTP